MMKNGNNKAIPDQERNDQELDAVEQEAVKEELPEEEMDDSKELSQEDEQDENPEQGSDEADKLREEINRLKDAHLRTLAEYDNYRKRSQKERESLYPTAVADTLEKILPVLDNFERALQAECSDETYKKGFEMIYDQFKGILEASGVTEINPQGEAFDPERHNAVMHIEDESYGNGEVIEVLQKGYQYQSGDRILRYAMVKVAN